MDEIEKMLRGWHGSLSRHPGRKPRYRVSLMRKDQNWFEGEGQTAKAALSRAIKAAGGSSDATSPLHSFGSVSQGTMFLYKKDFYMKTNAETAVRFSDGELCELPTTAQVARFPHAAVTPGKPEV